MSEDYNLSDLKINRMPDENGIINGFTVDEWISFLQVDLTNTGNKDIEAWIQELNDWKNK